MEKEMKQTWEITVSGGCKSYKRPEFMGSFYGTFKEAQRYAMKIEKETGRIMYVSIMIPQPKKI